jgi:hypothetical protein
LLAWVRDVVDGVTAGRYEEWVHLGEYRQAKGILHVPGGQDRTVTNNIFVPRLFTYGRHHRYDAYV